MAGISDKALKSSYSDNKYRFQDQELQNKEFNDGSGLEMYKFKYRIDDPQIGRFWSIDPLSDKYVYNSPYAFSDNKVTNHVELEGLEAEWSGWTYYRARERIERGQGEQARKEFDEGYGLGVRWGIRGAEAGLSVVAPPVGVPMLLSI